MKKGIILVINAVGLFSTFMPWFSLPLIDEGKGVDLKWSVIPLITLGINIVVFVGGKYRSSITSIQLNILKLTSSVALSWGFFQYFNYKNDILRMGDGNIIAQFASDAVRVHNGFFIYSSSCIFLILIGFLLKK